MLANWNHKDDAHPNPRKLLKEPSIHGCCHPRVIMQYASHYYYAIIDRLCNQSGIQGCAAGLLVQKKKVAARGTPNQWGKLPLKQLLATKHGASQDAETERGAAVDGVWLSNIPCLPAQATSNEAVQRRQGTCWSWTSRPPLSYSNLRF